MAVYGTILCLGDSLTHGARCCYGRSYPIELSDMLWEQFGQRWICAEEGVNGETSVDILRRTLNAVKKYPEAFEVVLLCGTNDSKDRVNTSPEIYKKNIEGILRILAVYGKEVILCTIPDLKGFGAPDYSKKSIERIEAFNKKLLEIAKENTGIVKHVVDMRGMDVDCYADGVHMNNKGYTLMAERVLEAIIHRRHFD